MPSFPSYDFQDCRLDGFQTRTKNMLILGTDWQQLCKLLLGHHSVVF